jgi:hypothetical protein
MAPSTATRPAKSFGASPSPPKWTMMSLQPRRQVRHRPCRPLPRPLPELGDPPARRQEHLPPCHSDGDFLLQPAHRLRRRRSPGPGLPVEPLPLRPQAGAAGLVQQLRHLLDLHRLRRGQVGQDTSLFIYRRGEDTVYLLYVDDIVLTAFTAGLLQRTIITL